MITFKHGLHSIFSGLSFIYKVDDFLVVYHLIVTKYRYVIYMYIFFLVSKDAVKEKVHTLSQEVLKLNMKVCLGHVVLKIKQNYVLVQRKAMEMKNRRKQMLNLLRNFALPLRTNRAFNGYTSSLI